MKENFRARSRGNHSHNGDQIRWGGRIPVDPEGFYDNVIGGFHTNRKSVFTHKKSPHQYGFNGYETKWFSRWLRKQVGRKWNDVYSEICQEFDARSHKGWYVREFMVRGRWHEDVNIRTFLDEKGEVRTYSQYNGRADKWEMAYFPKADGLYVHPVTGVLCYRELDYDQKWDKVRRTVETTKITLGKDEWYELEEVGGPSPYDLKFKAWFHYSEKEVPYEYFCPLTDVEAQAKADFLRGRSVYYRDRSDEDILKSVGYELKDSSGIPVWGKWYRGAERTTTKRSCNKKQLAEIRKIIAG